MNILIDGQTLETPEIKRGIGVYFKNVLENMIKQSYEHNWYIMISNIDCIKILDSWVIQRLVPLIDDVFTPCSDFNKTSDFTKRIEEIIYDCNIDVFWIPNPLMVNVLFPNKRFNCKIHVTIFDLIPYIMPIKEWASTIKKEYKRRLDYLKEEDINLLCISEATQKDLIDIIGNNSNIHTTLLAANSKIYYKKREKAGIHDKPQIVFTGGFDYRKNIYGAIEAFEKSIKLYPGTMLDKAIMFIVCKYSSEQELEFNKKIQAMGLENRIKLTGYITDQELSDLYVNSDVFFFPSLYEGFGLPILEAMLGGVFILSADNSSLPEVCGGYALLCDANDADDMAKKLYSAFQKAEKETVEDKQKRQEYALQFTWEKTAWNTLNFFNITTYNKVPEKKEKIAIVTPWPNQKTGIANYVYKLIPYLSEYYEIDIFVDNSSKEMLLDNKYGSLYNIEALDELHKEYKEIIYQIGNNSDFHIKIYEYLQKYQGIAEIHDFILHHFFYHSYYLKNKVYKYKEALEIGYGEKGLEHYNNIKSGIETPDENKFPMSQTICNSSRVTIFHNHWSKNQIQNNKTFVIPHACFDKEVFLENDKKHINDKLSNKIKRKENDLIIGCFGFVNANKRPEKVIEAVSNLIKKGHNLKLTFYGKSDNEDINNIIKEKMLTDNIFITGYLDKGEYEIGLEMCDIIVNLRYPSMGESSGTLCEAFKYGKPVLVSNINQYKEFPDEVCWKVDVNEYEVALIEAMLEYLINNEDVRNALGYNAKVFADNVLNPMHIAKMYYEVINKIIMED
ncbi:MAG: glycosyltransferase [Anaerocolumna sp.]